MADRRPTWRKAFDYVERGVGSRLEQAVQTRQFADVASLVVRAEAGARHWAERQTRKVWHAANLPAGSDVQRLSKQVVALDRQVRQLSDQLRDAESRPTGHPMTWTSSTLIVSRSRTCWRPPYQG